MSDTKPEIGVTAELRIHDDEFDLPDTIIVNGVEYIRADGEPDAAAVKKLKAINATAKAAGEHPFMAAWAMGCIDWPFDKKAPW